jgi:hypothetical protein
MEGCDHADVDARNLPTCSPQNYWSNLCLILSSTATLGMGPIFVSRWARLRLPTGQVADSYWKEGMKPLNRVRISRNVKVCLTILHVLRLISHLSFTWMAN